MNSHVPAAIAFAAPIIAAARIMRDGLRAERAYIVIGENNPNESCVCRDSNKVSNRWLGKRYDRAGQRDYWDGEE